MKTIQTIDCSARSIQVALGILRSGGLVVCPSDTVYGLLVDATNEEAVKKLIAFKERPVGKAISVFVDGLEMMGKVVDTSMLKPATKSLIPGPYTFVLPSLHHTSKLLESERGTMGVRYIGTATPSPASIGGSFPMEATPSNPSHGRGGPRSGGRGFVGSRFCHHPRA